MSDPLETAIGRNVRGRRPRETPKPLGGEASIEEREEKIRDRQTGESSDARHNAKWHNGDVVKVDPGEHGFRATNAGETKYLDGTEESAACAGSEEPSNGDVHMAGKRVTAEPEEQGMLIADTEHPDSTKIKRLARNCHKLQSEYAGAKEELDAAKEKLVQAMQSANLPQFKSGDVFVEVKSHDPTVKIKVGEESSEQADADGK